MNEKEFLDYDGLSRYDTNIKAYCVPKTRKVNGKELSSDITLGASDVSARPNTWTPSASDVGAVPTTRTVNGKPLSDNIALEASDISGCQTSAISDAGNYFTTKTVEGALQQVGSQLNGIASLLASI